MFRRTYHEELNRMKIEALKSVRRPHKHIPAPRVEGQDPNLIICTCGSVMGFVRDPKRRP